MLSYTYLIGCPKEGNKRDYQICYISCNVISVSHLKCQMRIFFIFSIEVIDFCF